MHIKARRLPVIRRRRENLLFYALSTLLLFCLLALSACASEVEPRSAGAAPELPAFPQNNPYGFTILQSLRPQAVSDMRQLGAGWVRYQLGWNKIEPQPGHFDWRTLDAAVALANAGGLHLSFPIQDAPPWALSQVCENTPFLPGPDAVAAFATALAQRYNGHNGHGYIDSYEIGNEEYDSMWAGTLDSSIPCRQARFYAPVLKAAYQAIKAQSPTALVGMFGLWWANTDHIRSFMQDLYTLGAGDSFDFANFHYYRCNQDPSQTTLVGTPHESPSFDLEWLIIHQVMTRNGQPAKPIWVTEVGWPTSNDYQDSHCVVTPQQQAQYMYYVLHDARASHIVQKLFWYTIDQADGMSITRPDQHGGKLPSYFVIQNFAKQYPNWG